MQKATASGSNAWQPSSGQHLTHYAEALIESIKSSRSTAPARFNKIEGTLKAAGIKCKTTLLQATLIGALDGAREIREEGALDGAISVACTNGCPRWGDKEGCSIWCRAGRKVHP